MAKKYSVSIPWHCSVIVEVEAESEDEAIEKACEDVRPSLCHQCSNEIELDDANLDYEPYAEEL